MLYVLLIEILHCLFKDLVKGRQFSAFETHSMKKINELLFQKVLTKVALFKIIVLTKIPNLVKIDETLGITNVTLH